MKRKQSSIMRFLFGSWTQKAPADEVTTRTSRRLTAVLPAGVGPVISLETALARSAAHINVAPSPSLQEPHYVLTYYLTKAGARSDFVQFLRYIEIEPPPGLIDSRYLNAENESDLVVGFGEWDSVADFNAFQDSPEFSDLEEEIGPLLEEAPVRYVFRSVGDLRHLAHSARVHQLTVRRSGTSESAADHYRSLERDLGRRPNLVAIRTGESADGSGLILDLIEWTSLEGHESVRSAAAELPDLGVEAVQTFLHVEA